MAGAAVDADFADDAQNDIFGGHAVGQRAVNANFHGFGLELAEGLRGEDVFHFGGADADGETAERAVCRGMAVAADDRFAGQGIAKIRPDDVDDALVFAEAVVIVGQAEFGGIAIEGVQLGFGNLVLYGAGQLPGGGVVVGGGDGKVGAADLAAGHPQAVKSLRRGYFVHQVQVDVNEGGLPRFLVDDVGIPNFLKHSSGGQLRFLLFQEAGRRRAGRRQNCGKATAL